MSKTIPFKKNSKMIKSLYKGVDLAILSKAIQALCNATSGSHGSDCAMIAGLAVEFMKHHDIQSEIVVGESAWRIDGEDAGACVVHVNVGAPLTAFTDGTGKKMLHYHVWIKLDALWFLDLTTYQLDMKAKALDALDGGTTPVSWCPDYLLFTEAQLSTFQEVQQSYDAGVAYYEQRDFPQFEGNNCVEIDQDDVNNLMAVYTKIKAGVPLMVAGPYGSKVV